MTEAPHKLQDLLDAFDLMGSRQERIEALIGLADTFEPVPARLAAPPYPEAMRVPNCESQAFAFIEPLGDGSLRYHFAIENPQGVSAMALAAIIDKTLSGEAPKRVLSVPADIALSFFGRELSMGKSAGLMGMMQMVHWLTRRWMATQAPSEPAPSQCNGLST